MLAPSQDKFKCDNRVDTWARDKTAINWNWVK